MIRLSPKPLYRTEGSDDLYIRLPNKKYEGMPLWQGVRKVWGPIYRDVYPPFHDWPHMFCEA